MRFLEVVVEVERNLIHQMHAVLASYVVLVAGIGEVVHLHIPHHTFAHEAEAMLPQHYGVYAALADEQFAFEIIHLVDE